METLVRTDRLIIRSWSVLDIEPYSAIVEDPEVMRFIGNGLPRDRAYAEEFVLRMIALFEERGWIRFAVEHAESGEFMGFCGFEMNGDVLDFGWRYARKFWGAGYGGEAALAVLSLGRTRYGLTGIESMSYQENVGSVKIFEKMGMRYLRESELDGKKVVHYGFPS
jgi:RimJ/RimL family protein N-acetyltransferase